MAKVPGQALRTGEACAPFRAHLRQVREASPGPSSWRAVQTGFLSAMQEFDDRVMVGLAKEGERQNGKGDYFNDLLAIILENASGADLSRRSGVKGLIFPNHNLDVTYPPSGEIVDVLLEAKMLGTPQHPGNATTQKITGRPGSMDMLKRCKEAGFKTIDLKAAYPMLQAASGVQQQEGISGDLTSWLHAAKPKSYLVAAVRVVSDQDARAVISMVTAMTQVMDGVGLFLYRPRGYLNVSLKPADYEAVQVPSNLELVRVLQRVTQDLRAAKTRFEAAGPVTTGVRLPSAEVGAALSEVDANTPPLDED